MSKPATSLNEWVQRITHSELPSFGQTLAHVSSISEFVISHAAEVTRVVLSDPNMTAKVLRLANTAYMNPTRRRINTISRAVIVLGFKAIRSLCVATMLLDQLLIRSDSEPLRREIARAFHTASLARELARMRAEKNTEEIFIAGLLFRLGEMAFWACGAETALKLHQQIQRHHSVQESEEKILGFRLRQLTVALLREWHINETLSSALLPDDNSNGAICVRLADAVSALPLTESVEMRGELASELLRQMAEFVGCSIEDARQLCTIARGRAVDALKACGVPDLAALLIGWPLAEDKQDKHQESHTDAQEDTALQLTVVRELASLALPQVDVNVVLQLVLEGLQRGAGLSRVAVALLNTSRTTLTAKYVLEWPPSDLLNKFQFEMNLAPVMHQIINHGECLWAWRDGDQYGFNVILKKVAAVDCLLGPLTINGKTIGVFYADRIDHALSLSDMESFMLFVMQSRLCLQNAQTSGH